MNKEYKCYCEFCRIHDLYRWGTIMNCGCGCHEGNDIAGHDNLCCEYPNGKKKDNPYKELELPEHYNKLLNKLNKGE